MHRGALPFGWSSNSPCRVQGLLLCHQRLGGEHLGGGGVRVRRRRRAVEERSASRPVSRVLSPPARGGGRPSIWDAGCPAPRAARPGTRGEQPLHRRASVGASLFGLAPDGVYLAGRSPGRRWALTPPFHRRPCPHQAGRRLCPFCGTLLRVAPTGCYPAPCSVEPGLSSSGARPPAAVRPACTGECTPARSGRKRPQRGEHMYANGTGHVPHRAPPCRLHLTAGVFAMSRHRHERTCSLTPTLTPGTVPRIGGMKW